MSNVLSLAELKRLSKLGKDMRKCLACKFQERGVPCRSDRWELIKLMREYLELHDYQVI